MSTDPSLLASAGATQPVLTEAQFFQDVPPGQLKRVKFRTLKFATPGAVWGDWEPTDLLLYCTSDECSGVRYFSTLESCRIYRTGFSYIFPAYVCRNCRRSTKRYALSVQRNDDEGSCDLHKFGELPQFGPPNPPKLMSLMGGERDAYLKGRRCENQGLGIAAFAYYRRVVENQKSKIIGEICKVAEKLNSDPSLIEELKAARNETRFTEAINRVKHGLPPVLLIDGHNPLTLLHSALSEGLHATSDEDCLELATSIRVVLTELVERMATAVKEEAELTSAVQRLLKAGGKKQ